VPHFSVRKKWNKESPVLFSQRLLSPKISHIEWWSEESFSDGFNLLAPRLVCVVYTLTARLPVQLQHLSAGDVVRHPASDRDTHTVEAAACELGTAGVVMSAWVA